MNKRTFGVGTYTKALTLFRLRMSFTVIYCANIEGEIVTYARDCVARNKIASVIHDLIGFKDLYKGNRDQYARSVCTLSDALEVALKVVESKDGHAAINLKRVIDKVYPFAVVHIIDTRHKGLDGQKYLFLDATEHHRSICATMACTDDLDKIQARWAKSSKQPDIVCKMFDQIRKILNRHCCTMVDVSILLNGSYASNVKEVVHVVRLQ